MNDKLPGIINYLIGAGVLVFLLFVLKRKAAERPHTKMYGLSLRTIFILIYVGITADLLLIVAILMGWISN